MSSPRLASERFSGETVRRRRATLTLVAPASAAIARMRAMLTRFLAWRRRRAEALLHLGEDGVDRLDRRRAREPAVGAHALVDRVDVLLGQERRHRQVDAHLRMRDDRLASRFADRLHQHLREQVEADRREVAGLLGAEQRAGAADLEVAHGDLDAAAQVGVLADGHEALGGLLGQRLVRREQEVRVGLDVAAADSALELVELREAQALRVLDDERVGVRVVDAGLDDGGRDEHVVLVGGERLHDRFELALRHLAVRYADPRLGGGGGDAANGIVDGLDPVADVVDLTAAIELATDRAGDDVLVPLAHVHLHREAVGRRRVDDAHVAHARQRHLQGARNRRRREGQHVDLLAEVLDVLLVLDAKALLFVDDDEPEVLRRHVARQQPVRADKHVDFAAREALERRLLLRLGAEAGEHLDAHRERLEALREGGEVLLRQESSSGRAP